MHAITNDIVHVLPKFTHKHNNVGVTEDLYIVTYEPQSYAVNLMAGS
jgi:hypothetical protein